MKQDIQAYNNVLELIGNTPLVKLQNITKGLKGNYYAKVEAFNPGHSSKDRIALYILEQAEKKGLLKPGDTIIETTSGNTGFSIAMISIIKGYECILAVSSKSSPDKIDMLRAMGAKVYVCPAHVSADDPRSYYQVAKRLHEEIKGSVYINQYFNVLNMEAHYHTTGKEIWEQTNGNITHLVACSGTGGTISGTAKYLKEQNPDVKILAVDDFDVIDTFTKVTDEASAHMARQISKVEGLFVGYTSGAAMQAIKQYEEEGMFDENSNVVVIFPDHGSRYMSKIYNNEWMNNQGFFDSEHEEEPKKVEYIK